MRVIWIIDNKYRELYGLYNLKRELLNHKIELYLFHLQVWKTAIDLINPNIIVIPNLNKSSCAPIVKYASKKKIDIFLHSSEGMFYSNEVQKDKYPKDLIKKVSKVLVWSKLDGKFLINNGFKNKVLVSGCLKFDKKNYIGNVKKNKKIKIIGIPTHNRVISGFGITKNNIPFYIRHWIESGWRIRLNHIKFEIEYIAGLVKILNSLNQKFKIILKVSPFEDPEVYRQTFPEFEIYQSQDIRGFLKTVDVLFNVYSSSEIDALKFDIPVINITNLLVWDKWIFADKEISPRLKIGPNQKYGAGTLSIRPKNMNELKKLLNKGTKRLVEICEKKNFMKEAERLACTQDTLKILTNMFLEQKKRATSKYINYLMLFKYIIVETRRFVFRSKRSRNIFRLWSFKDMKLLKLFKL